MLQSQGGRCSTCGGAAPEPLWVRRAGRERIFCTFLCAIRAMAPGCPRCGAIVLDKGVATREGRACTTACAARPAAV